jgi:hypothetical protein
VAFRAAEFLEARGSLALLSGTLLFRRLDDHRHGCQHLDTAFKALSPLLPFSVYPSLPSWPIVWQLLHS